MGSVSAYVRYGSKLELDSERAWSGNKKVECCSRGFSAFHPYPNGFNYYKNKQTAYSFRKSEAFRTEEMAVITWLTRKLEYISRKQRTLYMG